MAKLGEGCLPNLPKLFLVEGGAALKRKSGRLSLFGGLRYWNGLGRLFRSPLEQGQKIGGLLQVRFGYFSITEVKGG